MSDTRSQFIAAGFKLYPQHGYRKLSVRMLATEAGLSAGMFHHLFADKDAFVGEVLQSHHERSFGLLDFDAAAKGDAVAQLRHAVWLLATCFRDNLARVHRAYADSADGVEVVNAFMRRNFEQTFERLQALLEACPRQNSPAEQVQRLSYLSGAVLAPMALGTRFDEMGVLPAAMSHHIGEIVSDAAIARRIDWAFAALFPAQEAV